MDGPFGRWRSGHGSVTIRPYAPEGFLVIGLEIALIVLTLALFALFDLYVRACDRI